MSNRYNRNELLQTLETVQPGLSPRDIVEQSSCFVLSGGYVMTYNDEIACRLKGPFPKDIKGAVQAAPLLSLLRKMKEDELEVEVQPDEFIIVGKKRRGGIRMDAEVTLPIDKVEKPGDWKPLPEEFTDAVDMVQQCAGKDESQFVMTCVHFHPKWLESCDNFQLTRYKIKTGIEKSFLVRRDSVKHVTSLDMTEFSETEAWVHFRNPAGLTLSCRRWVEEYPDLNPILKFTGSPATLPKGLGDAADKAEIFSSENADNNQVQVELRPGKLRIKGVGVSGWYSEVKKLKYDGDPLEFQIAPKLLIDITNRHNDCEISPERLKVDGGKWTYVTCLSKAGTDNSKEEAPTEDTEAE